MRGRPRKPTPAKILQGTFRKDRENPDEPKPDLVKNLNAPTWLDQYGRECWDHYVPKLIKTGILTSIDVFLFAAVCERWSTFRRAADELQKGLTHYSESNGNCAKPEAAIAKVAYADFKQGLEQFGCSPASRGKVKAVLPEKDDPVANYRDRRGASRFLA